MTQTNKNSRPLLDKYKDTLQPMVDEALGVQMLAPAMKEAIEQNKPLNEALQGVTQEAIERNPKVRSALKKWLSENKAITSSESDLKRLVIGYRLWLL